MPEIYEPPSKYDSLPNIEAIVNLDKKTLLESYHYLDILAEEHAIAFTVSKMMDMDLLTETKQATLDAMKNGTDFNQFQQRLKPYLMSKGWWGEQTMTDPKDGKAKKVQLGSTRRLRTIYHTNKHTAYAAGQWQRIQATKKTFPYLMYTASVASKQRKDHKKYYNLVLPVDHPIWKFIMPPNGYGCLCGVQQLTQEQAEAIGITEDFEAEWEVVENPRTGKKVIVPKDIDISFAHNHGDRLGALLKIAADKHGEEFADKLKQLAKQQKIRAYNELQKELVHVENASDLLDDDVFIAKINNPPFGKKIKSWLKNNQTNVRKAKEQGLTHAELLAICSYTDIHSYLQAYLTGGADVFASNNGKESTKLITTQYNHMMNGLNKLGNYAGVVTRKIDATSELLALKVGDEYQSLAFMSTSYGGHDVFPNRNVKLILSIVNGKMIDDISVLPQQKEVLILPQTRFKIEKVESQENGELWITAQ